MKLKFQDYYQPKCSLQESLTRLEARYDSLNIPRSKIARSILVPTSDSLSVANTFKMMDKSLNAQGFSRGAAQSKVSSSVGCRQSKTKNRQKQEEISYYKVLMSNLQEQNQRLKIQNNNIKNNKISRHKASRKKKQNMDSAQIEYLASQIQNIQKRFVDDKATRYQKFYKKFIQQFRNVGMKVPRSIQNAWDDWLFIKRKIQSHEI